MDSTPRPAAPPAPPARPIIRLILLAGALAYGAFVYQTGAPYAAGADSSGYLNSARLLASGRLAEPVRTVAGLEPPAWNYFYHQPLGYAVAPGGTDMVPTYPVGLPLHYAAASWFVGFEKAARVVNALNVLAAGALLFSLARLLGLGRGWAVTAVALLWGCPIWIFHALQPLSDCVATTWILGALVCACRARHRLPWAAAAGACLGVAVLVRPSSILAAAPLAVILWRHGRAAALLAAGGLPAAVFLGWYNLRLYGSPFQSGYNQGGASLWAAFGAEFAGPNLRSFATWIPPVLSWPVVVLAGLGLPWLFRHHRGTALLLTLWFAAFVAFYTTYFCAGENWGYLRFLLPAFPAVILAALLAAQHVTARLPRAARRFGPAAVVGVGLWFQLSLAETLRVADIRSAERHYWAAARWIAAHAPADAILLTLQLSGAVTFYDTQPLVRWDQISRADFALLRRAAEAGHRPIYAPLFPFEYPMLRDRLGGTWTAVERVGDVTIWRLEPGP
jgi:hypothetical protein